jgi:hypothetical protein
MASELYGPEKALLSIGIDERVLILTEHGLTLSNLCD